MKRHSIKNLLPYSVVPMARLRQASPRRGRPWRFSAGRSQREIRRSRSGRIAIRNDRPGRNRIAGREGRLASSHNGHGGSCTPAALRDLAAWLLVARSNRPNVGLTGFAKKPRIPALRSLMCDMRRGLRDQRARVISQINQCLAGLKREFKKHDLAGFGGSPIRASKARVGPSGTVVVEGVIDACSDLVAQASGASRGSGHRGQA